MANETFLDAGGSTKYRKSTGAGTSGDPAVTHSIVDSSALPSGAATASNQSTIITAVQLIDDIVFADDAAFTLTSSKVAVMGAIRDDSLSTVASAETDAVPLRVTSTGALWVSPSGNVTVVGTGTFAVQAVCTNSGTFAVQAAQSGTWNIGTVTTVTTCSTVTTVSTLTGGGIAHDGADSGNPIKVGSKSIASQNGLTLVSANDRSDLYSDLDGAVLMRGPCSLADIVSGVTAITDGSSTSVISAAGSGIKIYVTSVIIANSSGSNVTVDLRDGTAGSVKATFPVPAGGGVVLALPVPLGFTANTAVAADPSAAASTITITLVGFKSKV